MNLKTYLKAFLIGLVVFFLVVFLGMKFNWVKYLQPASTEEQIVTVGALPEQTEPQSPQQTKQAPKAADLELVEETALSNSAEEQIRNDCIRASRHAGVGDDQIFTVVNKCVEMSKRSPGYISTPVETIPQEDVQPASVEDPLELTRKACQIVADEEEGITAEERKKIVEQCVKANMKQQSE